MVDEKWLEEREQRLEAFQQRQGKEMFYYKVKKALANGDEQALYALLPSVQDFCAFRDTQQYGTILHLMLEEKSNNCNYFFLKQVMKHYFPKDADEETLKMREELLLARNKNGRLCANYDIASKYILEINLPTKNKVFMHAENNTYAKYRLLKKWIKSITPSAIAEEEKHPIADEPNPYSRYETGRPVSSILILDEGTEALDAPECFPEISLRKVSRFKSSKDEVVTIKNIPIEPIASLGRREATKAFADKVIEQLDFPEDWNDYYSDLTAFATDYIDIRRNEELFAANRFFVKNRGMIIFEDKKDKESKGNLRDGKTYAGYASFGIDEQTGELYPFIVMRTGKLQSSKTFLHELFHQVDLRKGISLSDTDVLKLVLMLTQTDTNLQNITFKQPFKIVDKYYLSPEYEVEMVAQIMQQPKQFYEHNKLLRRTYQLGIMLAKAKVDDIPAIQNRIIQAVNNLPYRNELLDAYAEFMKIKQTKDKILDKGIKPINELVSVPTSQAVSSVKMLNFTRRHASLFARGRKDLEDTLLDVLHSTALLTGKNIPEEAKQVVLPPAGMKIFSEQNGLAEVNFIARAKQIRETLGNNKDIYLEKMANPDTSDKDFFIYRYLYAKETGQPEYVFAVYKTTDIHAERAMITENYKKHLKQKELFAKYFPDEELPDYVATFDTRYSISSTGFFPVLLLDEARGDNRMTPEAFKEMSQDFSVNLAQSMEIEKRIIEQGYIVVSRDDAAYAPLKMESLQKAKEERQKAQNDSGKIDNKNKLTALLLGLRNSSGR